MVEFTNTVKGQNAKRKFTKLMKDGWTTLTALEVLGMWGYSDSFSTDLYIK